MSALRTAPCLAAVHRAEQVYGARHRESRRTLRRGSPIVPIRYLKYRGALLLWEGFTRKPQTHGVSLATEGVSGPSCTLCNGTGFTTEDAPQVLERVSSDAGTFHPAFAVTIRWRSFSSHARPLARWSRRGEVTVHKGRDDHDIYRERGFRAGVNVCNGCRSAACTPYMALACPGRIDPAGLCRGRRGAHAGPAPRRGACVQPRAV